MGSSANSSLGEPAIAMAITARCSMPPDHWKGYSLKRCSGLGMPTRPSSSMPRSRACRCDMPPNTRSPSVIWSPMGHTGFRLVMGFWKIMLSSVPRSRRISSSPRLSRSRPSYWTAPSVCALADGGRSRRTLRQSTDLPLPDLPTIPSVPPRRTERWISSLARMRLWRPRNSVVRPTILRDVVTGGALHGRCGQGVHPTTSGSAGSGPGAGPVRHR